MSTLLEYNPNDRHPAEQRIGSRLPVVANYDYDWILISAFMILLMQFGFAALEAGSVRYKNVQSIIMKVVINTSATVFIWWAFGYGFAFGYDSNNDFIGGDKFGTYRFEADNYFNDYANFLFQTSCAAVAASIMSGGTAERMTFLAWLITSIVFSGFIYATGVHWTFGGGWLERYGYHDFAGSGVVHLVGGTGALVTLAILRPRQDRFNPDYAYTYPAHNPPLAALGCFVLYTCWLFFNAGTEYSGDGQSFTQGITAVNTFLAGSFGALTSYFLGFVLNKEYSLLGTMNGMLTGLVVVTGDCDNIHTWAACLFGIIGGIIYHIMSKVLIKAQIDDPIDAVPVHFAGGLTGTFLTGLFDLTGGLFYGGGGQLMGMQLVGILVFILWTGILTTIVLVGLKASGKLRINEDTELLGIDRTVMGGEACVFANEIPVQAPPTQQSKNETELAPPPPVYQSQTNFINQRPFSPYARGPIMGISAYR